jgi:threonine efflux protein
MVSSFFTLAFIHFLAVASPGPDFVLVTRNSIQGSRRIGIATAFGIMAGNALHIALFGFSQAWISASNPAVYQGIRISGGLYLVWMGFKVLRGVLKRPAEGKVQGQRQGKRQTQRGESGVPGSRTVREGFVSGFITTSLNGKAAVYFLTLVSQFVSPAFSFVRNTTAVILMLAISAGWFSVVSLLIGSRAVKQRLEAHLHKIDGLMGAVLLGFGVWVLLFK